MHREELAQMPSVAGVEAFVQLLDELPVGMAWTWNGQMVHLNREMRRRADLASPCVSLQTWAGSLRLLDGHGRPLHQDPLVDAVSGAPWPPRVLFLDRTDERVEALVSSRLIGEGRSAVAVVGCRPADVSAAERIDSVSHELKGTLHALNLGLTMARRAVRDGSARHYLDTVDSSARLLMRLIKELSDGSGETGAVSISEVALDRLLGEAGEWVELAPAHTLEIEVEPDLVVRADPQRLQQIVANLLSNASKYSRPGKLRLSARRIGERAVVSLSDEGPGIGREDLPRLFKRYSRLGGGETGSGLGLWLSRQYALRMRGEMWVESEPGRSSTFFLALPLGGS